MAKVESTVDVPLAPDRAWELAADLDRLGDWVTIHEAYRGTLPEQLAEGVKITSVVKVKGLRNRVDWTLKTCRPPHELVLAGKGAAGTKYTLTVTVSAKRVTAEGDGATIALRADLGGAVFFGPVGGTVARALKGDIEASLQNFLRLFG